MGSRALSSRPSAVAGVSHKDGEALVFKCVCQIRVSVETMWQEAFSILPGWNKGPKVRR